MPEEQIKILVGLGNPGLKFQWTRHNVGFLVIDKLISTHPLKEETKNNSVWWGRIDIAQQQIIVAKPLTFMNLGGEAVKWLSFHFKVPPCQILIIHDDLDLPWGRIKLVKEGGPGGHKGVISIQTLLGTKRIPRLKIGIGRPFSESTIDYVLSEFSPKEKEDLGIILNQVQSVIETVLKEGLNKAMSISNVKNSLLKRVVL
ncbi:MAG: aminoacyl-tRNA hydrolase [Candidatus Desulfofervidus auxilii]|nr:aminoacyl-tRNA hydrolase [Candidatus Desulfofervidus auxilii]